MNRFKEYLTNSYYRPSNILESLLAYFLEIFYTKKSKTFSEKTFIKKRIPSSVTYYNFLGRLIYVFINFLLIIIFNRIFDRSLVVEENEAKKDFIKKERLIISKGSDSHIWPTTYLDVREKEVNNKNFPEKNYFNDISESYKISLEDLDKNSITDAEFWKKCRSEFQSYFFDKSQNLIAENIKNFKNINFNFSANLLKFEKNIINPESRKNKMESILMVNFYHKLSNFIDLDVLRTASDNYAGNGNCMVYRNQRLNYRILRQSYFFSQLKKNIDLKKSDKNIFLDIGGGYGGLLRFLKHHYKNSVGILIDLPEVCCFAAYYLKSCFPESKIGMVKDFKNIDKIGTEELKNYDFVILNQASLKKFEKNIIDIAINTVSLGEMNEKDQDYYIEQIERVTKRYFYSVNRPKRGKLKFKLDGFYDFKLSPKLWDTKVYKFNHTFHLEFLGEKVS